MTTVGVGEAKTHLSRLLREVQDGAEVVIAHNGEPIAKLVPLARRRVAFGTARGEFTVPEDFDDPMSDEFLRHFT